MSETEAFCTFRILPRIGSRAWKSEDRASLAVPSAESPSTMNSSEEATSLLRQSASLAGIVEVSRAFLRRWFSLWVRAEMRDFISATTFSSSVCTCCFWARAVEVRRAVSCFSTTWETIRRTAEVPRISLVCPSNCGSASRTVRTAVMPASTSSFSTLSDPALSRRALASTWARNAFSSAASNPDWWVPPLGVAMMFTKDRNTVS